MDYNAIAKPIGEVKEFLMDLENICDFSQIDRDILLERIKNLYLVIKSSGDDSEKESQQKSGEELRLCKSKITMLEESISDLREESARSFERMKNEMIEILSSRFTSVDASAAEDLDSSKRAPDDRAEVVITERQSAEHIDEGSASGQQQEQSESFGQEEYEFASAVSEIDYVGLSEEDSVNRQSEGSLREEIVAGRTKEDIIRSLYGEDDSIKVAKHSYAGVERAQQYAGSSQNPTEYQRFQQDARKVQQFEGASQYPSGASQHPSVTNQHKEGSYQHPTETPEHPTQTYQDLAEAEKPQQQNEPQHNQPTPQSNLSQSDQSTQFNTIATPRKEGSNVEQQSMFAHHAEVKTECANVATGSPKRVLGEVMTNGGKALNDVIGQQSHRGEVGEKIYSRNITKLSQGIGINDRFLLMRDLFGGDNQRYNQTIARLDEFTELDEVMIYISENFDWNPDSQAVEFLVDLLERKLGL